MSTVQSVLEELARKATRSAATIEPQQELLTSGILDSLGLVSLVTWIEDTYGVAIDVMDIVMENFETPAAIAELIDQMRAGAS